MDLYLQIADRLRHFFEGDLMSIAPTIGDSAQPTLLGETHAVGEREPDVPKAKTSVDSLFASGNPTGAHRSGRFHPLCERVVRLDIEIPPLEPIAWLAKQTDKIQTYWADRQGELAIAGVGATIEISGNKPTDYATILTRARQHLSPLFPRVRYYGGMGFSGDRSLDTHWQAFGAYRFIIPKFEVWTDGNATYFACNFIYRSDRPAAQLAQILQEIAALDLTRSRSGGSTESISRSPLALPNVRARVDSPDWEGWQRNIDLALAKFNERDLQKIVLARRSILTFDRPIPPLSLLLALQPERDRSYHFCFQIDPTVAFIGTSPERLYWRHDRLLATEAIAGTRQRGASSQLDRELSDRLRNSPKDIHEHQLVVANLQAILSELCHSSGLERELTILKLNKVQHLYTQFQGTLKPDITDDRLLAQLHPTPAVGGFPRDRALPLIHELEPFDRGWYAAPVGWVSADAAEFAVAIRSGIVDGDRLLLFAGAGIVRGSQAADEWQEVENKIRHFTDLFADRPPQEISDLSMV